MDVHDLADQHRGETVNETAINPEQTDADREHAALCADNREYLHDVILIALEHVAIAGRTLDRLSSNEVYDVEYAEGGIQVDDLRGFLADASRALRAAERINRDVP